MAEKLVLTDGQQHVFDGIKSFLEDNAKEVFILRGYAGTGKTLLITFLGNYLLENNYHFDVLTAKRLKIPTWPKKPLNTTSLSTPN